MAIAVTGTGQQELSNVQLHGATFGGQQTVASGVSRSLVLGERTPSPIFQIQTESTITGDIAVEDLVGFSALSEESFAEDWESPTDSIYDDDDP